MTIEPALARPVAGSGPGQSTPDYDPGRSQRTGSLPAYDLSLQTGLVKLVNMNLHSLLVGVAVGVVAGGHSTQQPIFNLNAR